jgi:molybdenum cofactor cytidylyltransferase
MDSRYILCGLILSAGASSRMGQDKALLPWPPATHGSEAEAKETLLSASIAALKPFTQAVIVVAGKNAARIAPVIEASGAHMVVNPDPDRGQFSSMQIGLAEVLKLGHNAAMITPVDCPPLSAASLEVLRAAFEQALARGKWAVAPEKDGKRGHPLFAGPALIEKLLAAPVTSNAKEVKWANADAFEYTPVSDSLLTIDINTPEQYAALGHKPNKS